MKLILRKEGRTRSLDPQESEQGGRLWQGPGLGLPSPTPSRRQEPIERDKFYTCLKILRMSVDISRPARQTERPVRKDGRAPSGAGSGQRAAGSGQVGQRAGVRSRKHDT